MMTLVKSFIFVLLIAAVSQASHVLKSVPVVEYDYRPTLREIVNGDDIFGPWFPSHDFEGCYIDHEGNCRYWIRYDRIGLVFIQEKDAEIVRCVVSQTQCRVWGEVIMHERKNVYYENEEVKSFYNVLRLISLTNNSKVVKLKDWSDTTAVMY